MLTTTRRLAAILLAVLVIGASPAAAETGSTPLPRHDGPRGLDLTHFTAINGTERFHMEVEAWDLHRRGVVTFQYWRGRHLTPPWRNLLITVRLVDDQPQARFLTCGTEDCVPGDCPGLRARWEPDLDFVSVSAPQDCYPRRKGTAPPPEGRFFAWAQRGAEYDDGNPEPLLLTRGPRS